MLVWQNKKLKFMLQVCGRVIISVLEGSEVGYLRFLLPPSKVNWSKGTNNILPKKISRTMAVAFPQQLLSVSSMSVSVLDYAEPRALDSFYGLPHFASYTTHYTLRCRYKRLRCAWLCYWFE